MKTQQKQAKTGSTIICALSTILIISLIGANVLLNCATRYNASSKQVKGWKEALYAAEAGGDIGFNEVRKICSSPATAFSTSGSGSAPGWTPSPGFSPVPTPSPAGMTTTAVAYTSGPYYLGQSNSLQTSVTVDKFYTDPADAQDFYRIRATGTAKLFGIPRVGMDDRMDGSTRGDAWLRRIDFAYNRFKTTFGDGDNNALDPLDPKTVSAPQMTRRIELITVPITAFTGALKVTGTFGGPGSAGVVDSYDSKNGAYTFVANNPASPYYSDSRNGDVSVATPNFTEGGPIYGNVTTNGGTVSKSGTSISGTIDNNVPFTIPPLVKPANPLGYTSLSSGGNNITPVTPTGTVLIPNWYVVPGNSSSLTINSVGGADTYVTVVVNGDLGKITIANHVRAKIYFTGNMNVKAVNLVNNNVDGTSPYISRAGQMQIYGISPTDGSTQTIQIDPPGSVYATIYAPNGDMTLGGNPDWYGAIVAHNFLGNGNTGFHYDKQIAAIKGVAIDYQLASYIEDVR